MGNENMAEADKPRSGVDPLSPATRSTKKGLLIAALAAMTFKGFDVKIHTIDMAGLHIDFDGRVFDFLLVAALAYFLVSFCLYYYIDIRNFSTTKHQDDTEKWRLGQLGTFANNYLTKVRQELRHLTALDQRFLVTAQFSSVLTQMLKAGNSSAELERLSALAKKCFQFQTVEAGAFLSAPLPKDRMELAKQIEIMLEQRARQYPRAYSRHRSSLIPRTVGVRFAYQFRNYWLDGIFPALTGVIGLLAMFNVVPLRWLSIIIQ